MAILHSLHSLLSGDARAMHAMQMMQAVVQSKRAQDFAKASCVGSMCVDAAYAADILLERRLQRGSRGIGAQIVVMADGV